MATSSFVRAVRWVARTWTVLSILFVGMFAVGEILGASGPGPTLRDWIGLVLWPIGVVIGLAVAWHHEEGGGFLALGCLVAFYAWSLLVSGHMPRGPFFFLVAAPALLFFVVGFVSHHHHHRHTTGVTHRHP